MTSSPGLTTGIIAEAPVSSGGKERPGRALWVTGACAIVLVWWGTFEQILTYTTVVITLFYILTTASVMIWRIRDPGPRPYRVWGYPVTPLLFILTMVGFVVSVTLQQPRETLFGFALLGAGLPLYAWSKKLTKVSE